MRPPEREHEREPAPAREGNEDGQRLTGRVVELPTTTGTVAERDRPRGSSVVTVWFRDAAATGRAAVDGSVWRARPPALRDLHARVARAEWAGEVPALRVAGQVFGYAAVACVAVLYAAAWVVERPLRVAVAVGVAVPLLVLLWT